MSQRSRTTGGADIENPKVDSGCLSLPKMGDQRIQFTLDEAISAIGFGKFHVFALVFAGLGWIAEAMEMMILSVVGPAVQSEWGISPSEESMLGTVVFAGMLVGSYIWGHISDTYGRRKAFLGATVVTAAAGLCSALAPDYKTLLFLRCLLGFSIGGGPSFVIWFIEFIPTPNRGAWMIVVAIFWTLGTIFEALLAWIIVPNFGWRWLIALSSMPSFLVILLAGSTPESPRYLCAKGRITEAQHVFERVARLNRTKLPPGVLVLDQAKKKDEEQASQEETPLLSSAGKKMGDSETFISSFLSLFSPKLLRTTILVWLLYFGNVFGYYGIVLLTSELPSAQSSCRSAHTLSVSENAQDNAVYRDALINSLAELPALAFSAITVDRIGRKLTMGISASLSFIFLLPLLWNNNETVTVFVLFGVRMFISSSFQVASIYVREVYPTSVRSTGVGIASAVGRIGGIICPFVAVALVRGCHQTATVVLFESVFAVLALSIPFLPLEPNAKELCDVVQGPEEQSSN